MLRLLRRLPVIFLIILDGAWWFVACLSILAGWRYGYAGLHSRGVLLLLLVAGLHFVLNLFPMRWLSPLTDRLYDDVFCPRRDQQR